MRFYVNLTKSHGYSKQAYPQITVRVAYFRSTSWVLVFLICFLSRLFLQLEDFLFKRKVSNAFSWFKSQDLSWFVKMIVFFGCKAADCLKVACVADCLLIVFEKSVLGCLHLYGVRL